MDTLHSPWRIRYILGPKQTDADGRSIFAAIGQSSDDLANYVLCRGRSSYAVLNSYPYSAGHTLICPYRQVADPYNAQRGFWYSHCGWLFASTQTPEGTRLQVRLRQEGSLAWQERYYLPIVLSGLLIPLGIGFVEGGWLTALGCLLLVGFGRIFLVMNSTFCINSVCHLWGPQPHTLHDSSRDNWWVSLITFGEGYHNYHHAHPSDYRNGPLWFNVDPSKWVIWSLIQLGLSTPRGQQ